jgi:hypothetical protein
MLRPVRFLIAGQFFLRMTTDRPEVTRQVFEKFFPDGDFATYLDQIYRDGQIHDELGQPGDATTMKLTLGGSVFHVQTHE